MKISDINTFLILGYYLDYENSSINFDYSKIDKTRYSSYSKHDLISEGTNIFMNAISRRFNSNSTHVVPISGGLDSRAILAGLLENTEAMNIQTYTFGIPGTLDYEIGNFVAQKLGTKHTSFSLNDQNYNTEDLIDISNRFDNQTVLFHHPPIKLLHKYYGDSLYWSGFMGDPLAGSHLRKDNNNIEDILSNFMKKNTFVKSINLTSPSYKINDSFEFIDYDFDDIDRITLGEKIDFGNRQLKYVAPHVLMKGINFSLPFLDEDWFNFILSVDNKFRENEFLYKKILLDLFPQAFSLKTKTNYGAPLNASGLETFIMRMKSKVKSHYFGSNVNLNYIDFKREIRENISLKQTILENLHDLIDRKLLEWINIEEIWNNHINKEMDYADAILVLCSLEIQLKARELGRNN